jgi:hypothetical protein
VPKVRFRSTGEQKPLGASAERSTDVLRTARPKMSGPVPARQFPPQPASDVTSDLIDRVGRAIDEWRAANGLQTLPGDVVLQQVASILGSMAREMRSDVREPD